jgi:hypothetical protein
VNSPERRNPEKAEVNAALMLISSISMASGARICSSISLIIGAARLFLWRGVLRRTPFSTQWTNSLSKTVIGGR